MITELLGYRSLLNMKGTERLRYTFPIRFRPLLNDKGTETNQLNVEVRNKGTEKAT